MKAEDFYIKFNIKETDPPRYDANGELYQTVTDPDNPGYGYSDIERSTDQKAGYTFQRIYFEGQPIGCNITTIPSNPFQEIKEEYLLTIKREGFDLASVMGKALPEGYEFAELSFPSFDEMKEFFEQHRATLDLISTRAGREVKTEDGVQHVPDSPLTDLAILGMVDLDRVEGNAEELKEVEKWLSIRSETRDSFAERFLHGEAFALVGTRNNNDWLYTLLKGECIQTRNGFHRFKDQFNNDDYIPVQDGRINGIRRVFAENGTLIEAAEYRNGRRNGWSFHQNASTNLIQLFKDGEPVLELTTMNKWRNGQELPPRPIVIITRTPDGERMLNYNGITGARGEEYVKDSKGTRVYRYVNGKRVKLKPAPKKQNQVKITQ